MAGPRFRSHNHRLLGDGVVRDGPKCRAGRTPDEVKRNGVVYTPPDLAHSLVAWAHQLGAARYLDPACGDGAFLSAIASHGGEAVGVDVDAHACSVATKRSGAQVICCDFMCLPHAGLGEFDAIVGNPPYVRYQLVPNHRVLRHLIASETGKLLPGTSNYWALFVARSVPFLRRGGSLGMVVPTELLHARYAEALIGYLAMSFDRVEIVVLDATPFPDYQQGVVCLLCSGACGHTTRIHIARSQSVVSLGKRRSSRGVAVGDRLSLGLLPPWVVTLYRDIANRGLVPLGDIATVDIGYVTGDNDFFHCNEAEASSLGIPVDALQPVVRSASQLTGVQITAMQLRRQSRQGMRNLLISIGRERSTDDLTDWLTQPAAQRAQSSYKCRIRDPWYSVQLGAVPDYLLPSMASEMPRLYHNTARVHQSNTLLGVRLRSARPSNTRLPFAGLFGNPLTRLSAEIEGKRYGGGVLKLEPSDAERLLIFHPELARELWRAVRENRPVPGRYPFSGYTSSPDWAYLAGYLGISVEQLKALDEVTGRLRSDRTT